MLVERKFWVVAIVLLGCYMLLLESFGWLLGCCHAVTQVLWVVARVLCS